MLTTAARRRLAADARFLTRPNGAIARSTRTSKQPNPLQRATSLSLAARLAFSHSARQYAPKKATAAPVQAASPRKPRTTAKKTSSTKSKAAAKPKPKRRTKPAKAKKAKKPAAKAKPRKVRRKPLTEEEALKAKVSIWRKAALLRHPKLLPTRTMGICVAEAAKGDGKGETGASLFSIAATMYRDMPGDEKARYDQIAVQNQAANAKTMQDWTLSHTPEEIRVANIARRRLSRLARKPAVLGQRKLFSRRVQPLQDARLPTSPGSAFTLFSRDKWATGDFRGMALGDAAREIAKQWKALSQQDRQPYQAVYDANKAKYITDMAALRGTSETPAGL